MSENLKNRLRNYGLWMAVASFVLLLAQTFGVQIATEEYKALVNGFLSILVMLGLLNNPTTESKWYGDDTK